MPLYSLLVLSRSTIMQNFRLLAWQMTDLLLFEIFGIWYLVLFGILWYSIAWYGLLVLCRYTTMQNFGLLALKLTELWLFKLFGCWYVKYLVFGMIWYFRVWYSMVWYGLLESTRTENFGHLVWKRTELWLFEIFGIWYDLVYCGMVWYGMIQFVGII